MSKYLDNNGLLYLWGKIKALVSGKVDKVEGKTLTSNDYTTAEKEKLAGIASQANKYSHPTSDGNKHVPATGTTSSGKFLMAGSTAGAMSWEALTKAMITALGIPAQDTVYTHPTQTARQSGLYKITVDATGHITAVTAVAKADITALGIPSADTVYTHPTATAQQSGLYKITVDATGHITAVAPVAKADITALGIPGTNTTYSAATQSANGLMSAADKTKLDGFGAASTYALKSDITGMYKYKGSKAAYANLPTSGNTNGDVWNVEATGMNYAWNGSAWDALGEVLQIATISNSEIDTIVAS